MITALSDAEPPAGLVAVKTTVSVPSRAWPCVAVTPSVESVVVPEVAVESPQSIVHDHGPVELAPSANDAFSVKASGMSTVVSGPASAATVPALSSNAMLVGAAGAVEVDAVAGRVERSASQLATMASTAPHDPSSMTMRTRPDILHRDDGGVVTRDCSRATIAGGDSMSRARRHVDHDRQVAT